MSIDQIVAKLIAFTDEADRRRQRQLESIVAGVTRARQRRELVEVGLLLLRNGSFLTASG